MRQRIGSGLTAVLLAAAIAPSSAMAEAHAPPALAPSVAQLVAAACPGTGRYADALVRGISKAEADAAAPALARCAAQIRLPEFRWKTNAAELGRAAVALSQGLLDHDAAQLRRAADATRDLSRNSRAPDAEVRTWTVIPDFYDVARGEAVVVDAPRSCADATVANAAYINLAARTGTAWIDTPRSAAVPAWFAACRYAAASGPPSPYDGSYRAGAIPYDTSSYRTGGSRDGFLPAYGPGEH
jgi:hypothetical protein